MTSKQLTKRQRKAQQQSAHNSNGGLIQVSFTFGGKKHMESHRLTQSEVAEQMRMLKEHGPQALEDSAIVQVALASGRLLGSHVINEAFKDFIRENWTPKEDAPTAQEVVDEIAKRRGVVLSKQQMEAVDDTAGIQSGPRTVVHRENGKVTSITNITNPPEEDDNANPQRIPTI